VAGHTRRPRPGDLVFVDHPASTHPKKWPPHDVETVFFPGPVDNGFVVDGPRSDGVYLVEDLNRLDRHGKHPQQYVHSDFVHRKA